MSVFCFQKKKKNKQTNKQTWDHGVRKANPIKKKNLKTFNQESGPIILKKREWSYLSQKSGPLLLVMF